MGISQHALERRHRVRSVAKEQHGLISRAQLLAAGLSSELIAYWVRTMRLTPVLPTVYAVGSVEYTTEARWQAALLWAGADATLSHHSAAMHWNVLPPHLRTSTPHLTTRRRIRGDATHCHTADVEALDRTVRSGLATTTLQRTIVDLAAHLRPEELTRVIHETKFRHPRRLHLGSLRERAEQSKRMRGRLVLLTSLALYEAGGVGVRSHLELRGIRVLEAHGVRPDHLNTRVAVSANVWRRLSRLALVPADHHAIEVDLLFTRSKLVLEIDGPGHERPPCRFDDATRHRLLAGGGLAVVRWSHREIAAAERTGQLTPHVAQALDVRTRRVRAHGR